MVVWRYPVLLTGDMKVLHAVELPVDAEYVSFEGIFLSLRDAGITDLGQAGNLYIESCIHGILSSESYLFKDIMRSLITPPICLFLRCTFVLFQAVCAMLLRRNYLPFFLFLHPGLSMSKVQWLVLPMLLLSAASPLPPQVVQVTETTMVMAWSRVMPTPSSRCFTTLLRSTMTLSSKWRMKGCSNGSESLRMEILPALKPYLHGADPKLAERLLYSL